MRGFRETSLVNRLSSGEHEVCACLYLTVSLGASSLRVALAGGQELEKEGELATMSLEFEYRHQKSRCEMLIGGDDISKNVITLATCFSMFVYSCVHFRFALIGTQKSDSSVYGEPQEKWRWNSNSRDIVASSPPFSCPAA